MKELIGVDLGGTKVLTGKVIGDEITELNRKDIPVNGNKMDVLQSIYNTIRPLISDSIVGIGIGVPSVVDIEKGIVYDVQNIPSWKEVHLKELMEKEFGLPVYVNNDANCFAAGEKYYGEAKECQNFVGLIVGTGLAGGIILNNKLYNGANCGAGEFGMLPYLDHNFEYYCSGQFFQNKYNSNGFELHKKAKESDQTAIQIFREFGQHFGKAIQSILYSYDPEMIILGGSISKAYSLFKESMLEALQSFAYKKSLETLQIRVSERSDIAILGAAALFHNAK